MVRAAPSSVHAGGSQFSRLLASSRLSSHSPIIPQTYTAPTAHLARGDFGVKRSLPSRNKPIGSLRYVDIEALDTREGQTIWTECEHPVLLKKRFGEFNARVSALSTTSHMFGSRKGILGPRISTTFDPSTRRSVPTEYSSVPDTRMRAHLQSEALQGRAPVYRKNILAGNAMSVGLDLDGPFGSRAGEYTVKVPVPVTFRAMDEKQFEKYLDFIRSQRTTYCKQATLRAAEKERRDLVSRFEKESIKILNANRIATRTNDSTAQEEEKALTEPEAFTGAKIPLPDIAGEYTTDLDGAKVGVDLWNESRTENPVSGNLWQSWLREKDELRSSQGIDSTLPGNPAPGNKLRNKPMHPSAGLQYGSPDLIQTKLLSDAVPGRLWNIQSSNKSNQNINRRNPDSVTISVAVGGQIASMQRRYVPSPRFIDWTQQNPQQNLMMVKPDGIAELVYDGNASITASTSLPIWSAQGGNSNRSASAASIVAQKANEAAELESFQDLLRQSTLPGQFGQLSMKLRPANPGNHTSARGQPGSTQWVGEIDGKLNYRLGESERAPIDYGSLGQTSKFREYMRESSESEQKDRPMRFNSAKGIGQKSYSLRELRRANRLQDLKFRRTNSAQGGSNLSNAKARNQLLELAENRNGSTRMTGRQQNSEQSSIKESDRGNE